MKQLPVIMVIAGMCVCCAVSTWALLNGRNHNPGKRLGDISTVAGCFEKNQEFDPQKKGDKCAYFLIDNSRCYESKYDGRRCHVDNSWVEKLGTYTLIGLIIGGMCMCLACSTLMIQKSSQ